MIVSKSLAELKAMADQQPAGYLEYLLLRGKIKNGEVFLDEAAQDEVREKFPFLGQEGVFSQPMLEAGKPYQPAGYVEFFRSRGKILGEFIILSCQTLAEFNKKFPFATRARVYERSQIEAYFKNKPKGMLPFVLSQAKAVGNFLILSPQDYAKVQATFSTKVNISYNISSLRASAHERPEGYVDYVLAHAKIDGDFAVLEPKDWKMLMKMYPPEPKAEKYTRAELQAEAAWRPKGYADYALSIGKIENGILSLDIAAQQEINRKFPASIMLHVARLKEEASRRPKGYVDDVLALGKVDGDFVILDTVTQKKIRDKYPNPFLPHPREPTLEEMASNFTGAMADWAKAGFKTVAREIYEKRLAVCNACEHWDPWARIGMGKCKICGCTKFKFWLSGSKCPDKPPRW